MRSIALLLALMLFAANAAEPPGPAGLWPLPPWTGSPPPDLAETQFVYMDEAAGEYVLSWPEGVGTADRTGRRITVRWEPANRVDPKVRVKLTRRANGTVSFEYTLANGPQAKREIWWFSIVASSGDNTISTSHPTWHASAPSVPHSAAYHGLKDGPELRIAANMGRFVSWVQKEGNPRLIPGTSEPGFLLSSKFRPGIVTVYAHSSSVLATPVELPGPVHDQVVALMKPEVDYRSTLTIGPKFDPQTSDSLIAADYSYCVRRLVKAGTLSAESAFVKQALSFLDASVEGNKGIQPKFAAEPSTPFESEIRAALELAFSK